MGSVLTKITTGLFVGNLMDESDSNLMVQFTHILTIFSKDSQPVNLNTDKCYIRKCISVDEDDPVSLLKLFPDTISFILNSRLANGIILVNSYAGSMTNIPVVIAYLLTEFQQLDLKNAILLMRNKSSDFLLDDWVYKQLVEFEKPGTYTDLHNPSLPNLENERNIFNTFIETNSAQAQETCLKSDGAWTEMKKILDNTIDKDKKEIPIVRRRTITHNSFLDESSYGTGSQSIHHSNTISVNLENSFRPVSNIYTNMSSSNENIIFDSLKKDLNRRLEIDDVFSSDSNDFLDSNFMSNIRPSDRDSTEDFVTDDDDDDDDDAFGKGDSFDVPGSIDIPRELPELSWGKDSALKSYMPVRSMATNHSRETKFESSQDANISLEENLSHFQISKTAPASKTFHYPNRTQ